MPARPMRSKGCRTCRRRKVKCDELRPYCKRCSNAWLACEGYSVEVGAAIFVNSTVQNVTVYNNCNGSAVVTTQSSPVSPVTTRTSTPASPEVPRNPNRPYRENAWVTYLATYLFPGSIHSPQLGSWIFEMINLDSTSLSYLTSCCLGSALFGRTHGMIKEDLKAAGEYYEQALSKLNENLRDPDLWQRPANVSAAMLLGIYELMVFGSSDGFVKHAGGVGTLIRSRGAASHKTAPAKSYFIMSRTHIITEALVHRKRTFLLEPEWMSITRGMPKCPMRDNFEAIDLFAHVPNILADSDEAQNVAKSTGQPPSGFIDRFTEEIIHFLSRLFAWRWAFERRLANLAYEVPVTSGSLSVDGQRRPLFDTAIYYRDFHLGRQPGQFVVAAILVLEAARFWGIMDAPARALAMLDNDERPRARGPLIMPHERLTADEAALEIVRSVEYYLQGQHRFSGALLLLLPLRVVNPYVTDARQRAWLKRVTDRMADVHGFEFSTRLQDPLTFRTTIGKTLIRK